DKTYIGHINITPTGLTVFPKSLPAQTVDLAHLHHANLLETDFSLHGLNADYFDGPDLKDLRASRMDPAVNFEWIGATPTHAIIHSPYSARWTGEIQPRWSEAYTFSIAVNGLCKL